MFLRNVLEREFRRLFFRVYFGSTVSVEREIAVYLIILWGRNDLLRGEKFGKIFLLIRFCFRYRFRKVFLFKKGLLLVFFRGLASFLFLVSLSEF